VLALFNTFSGSPPAALARHSANRSPRPKASDAEGQNARIENFQATAHARQGQSMKAIFPDGRREC